MEEFAQMVNACEPLVEDIIGFMDGVSIPTECMDEEMEQNAMYCRYSCDKMVNNVFFAFRQDGMGFLSAINFPSS
jgi:hypothetical protein